MGKLELISCNNAIKWRESNEHLNMQINVKMTGETPEVRSDKRKPRDKKVGKQERKEREKKENWLRRLGFF